MTTIKLYPMTCGWLTGPTGGFLEGEHGRLRVPVPSYLIEHAQGLVVVDSGMHPEVGTAPGERLGAAAAIFTAEFEAHEHIAARLAAIGVEASKVRFLINTHLHFDHAGGNALLPNATLVVQRREWEAGRDHDQVQRNYYDRRDYDLGHSVRTVDGEHDLFGDGRVVCVPTYGHTPGHQSVRIRLDSGEVVLTGDACYLRRTLEELHLPAIAYDKTAMLDSLHRLRALRDAGARIFYGHDADFWATVPQAPATVL